MDAADVGCLLVEEAGCILGILTERDVLCRVVAARRDPDDTPLSEIMSAPVRTCEPSDDLRGCAKRMALEHIRHLAVLDGGEPVGLISLRDVLAALGED